MGAGRDKMNRGSHYCSNWHVIKKAGKVWRCPQCGAVFTCKEIKGRLHWLQTKDGRQG